MTWDEWAQRFATRDETAREYAKMSIEHDPSWPIWESINKALVRRWSIAGLEYIKTEAWKIRVHESGGAQG